MLICIETFNRCVCGYKDCTTDNCSNLFEIYGSWNNWTKPLSNVPYLSFPGYDIYNIETNKITISYKIKSTVHNEYILLDGVTTVNDNGFVNNQVTIINYGCWTNGRSIVELLYSVIKMHINDKLILCCEMESNKLNGRCVINYVNGNKLYVGGYKDGVKDGYGTTFYEDENEHVKCVCIRPPSNECTGNECTDSECTDSECDDVDYDDCDNINLSDHWDICCFNCNHPDCEELDLYYSDYCDGCKEHCDKYREYTGYYKDGLKHNTGTTFYENGNKEYEGEYKDDLKHGTGTTFYESGNKEYEGGFENDRPNGKGVIYRETGSKKYEGSAAMAEDMALERHTMKMEIRNMKVIINVVNNMVPEQHSMKMATYTTKVNLKMVNRQVWELCFARMEPNIMKVITDMV